MKPSLRYLLVLSLWVCACGTALGSEARPSCIPCHEKANPLMVEYWRTSAHAEEKVLCETCHGDYASNHDQASGTRQRVEASVCATCHQERAQEHFASKHGVGFRAGQACTRNRPGREAGQAECGTCHAADSGLPREKAECARFLAQSPEMRRQGCNACHGVENRCDTCHTAHDTNLETARNPSICATCHMGPDHAQYEMWQTSKHGILYELYGPGYAPDCLTCHMPEGTHNVSTGVSMGLAGQPYPEEVRKWERGRMVSVCRPCHTKSFSEQSLGDADAIQKQSKALLDEAAGILKKLNGEGLLFPSPAERLAHPLSGPVFDIGPQMLYENLSSVEAEFFVMKKFHYVTAYKGAFHQNPDYAHWYGNAPLKLSLSRIRSEAELLRSFGRLRARLDNLGGGARAGEEPGSVPSGPEARLRELKDRFLSGQISQEEYDRQRVEILDASGL